MRGGASVALDGVSRVAQVIIDPKREHSERVLGDLPVWRVATHHNTVVRERLGEHFGGAVHVAPYERRKAHRRIAGRDEAIHESLHQQGAHQLFKDSLAHSCWAKGFHRHQLGGVFQAVEIPLQVSSSQYRYGPTERAPRD